MKLHKVLQSSKGFTLIELLIVIAVLGILATVVIVGINPGEQLARSRDAGRKATVTQLGNAWQVYATSQNLSAFPGTSATWQTTLQSGGAISSVFTAPTVTTPCGPATGNHNGYCYVRIPADPVNSVPEGYMVWTALESTNDSKKAGAGTACTGANPVAAFIYNSTVSKAGLACTSTSAAPAYNITLY